MIYELKAYTPHKGKEAALRARFLEKTLPIFEKHGIVVTALFTPADAPAQLWYMTRFQNDQSRRAAWAAFQADAEWQAVKKETEADGPLLEAQTTTVLNSLDDAFAF
jgi:hypothetical protein